jgi:phage tail sheath protein FI
LRLAAGKTVDLGRTLTLLEDACRLVVQALVFEPNTASTWDTIRREIGRTLTSAWRRGHLIGASPEAAFSVHVGLGETMTAEEVLDGVLRVTVLAAVVRPAEYIQITVQQQMSV